MKKLLLAAFGPFGGETTNPALEAVRLVPDRVAGAEVVRLELPVSFARAGEVLMSAVRAERPDVALCVGQAAGRACVSVEQVAINLIEARAADEDGVRPQGVPIVEDGPAAFFATVPVGAMAEAARAAGVPAQVSYTAGTYVCNAVMYQLLWGLERELPGARGGFVHVPYAPAQVVGKPAGTPSMALADEARALVAAAEAALA